MADHVMPHATDSYRRTILDPGERRVRGEFARGEKITPRARARPAPARASGGRASGIRERQPTSGDGESRETWSLSLLQKTFLPRYARNFSVACRETQL